MGGQQTLTASYSVMRPAGKEPSSTVANPPGRASADAMSRRRVTDAAESSPQDQPLGDTALLSFSLLAPAATLSPADSEGPGRPRASLS